MPSGKSELQIKPPAVMSKKRHIGAAQLGAQFAQTNSEKIRKFMT